MKIPDNEGLMRATAILGEVAQVATPAAGNFKLPQNMSVVDAIVEIIRRHPMGEAKIGETLSRLAPGELQETLTELETISNQGGARAFSWNRSQIVRPKSLNHSQKVEALNRICYWIRGLASETVHQVRAVLSPQHN